MAENRTQAVRELVVTICHEFNNPLAAVKISYDLLKRLLSSENDRRLLQTFEQNYLQIEKEIRRLRDLNFERIDFPHS
jgi:nitrogen-specific signal transduction histidine kinase